jgi:acyl-CoA dehydrogenase family protein 9
LRGEEGTRGFLEDLYFSGFDRERFESLSLPADDAGAAEVIRKYEDLIGDFPPGSLEKKGTLPEDLLEGLKGIGLFGLNIPSVYGGLGLSIHGYLKVLEAVARRDMALALIPTAHLSIGLKGIILYGTEEQKRAYLPRAARGDMIFAYALTEPGTGSDARNIETRAALSEDGVHYILEGQKTYITNANYAGAFTVFAQLDPEKPGRMGAFIVERDWEGVTVGRDMPKMGLGISSTASLSFKGVRVPAGNLLGGPGDGFRIAMMVLNYGRLGLGAASVGVMEQSLEDMRARAVARKQFGTSIGDFPLVQEKMVRARVHAFVARSMTDMTSRIFEEDPLAVAALESSHTKLYGTTRAWNTLYDALQVAGGAGYISTQPYGKRMRDFRVTTVFEGTTEIHSLYPALFLLRSLGKDLASGGRGRIRQFFSLVAGLLKSPPWTLTADEAVSRRAERRARYCARKVRKMVHLTLLFYGRKAVKREFLLRRITHLSLAAFGILSVLARLESVRRGGGDAREELRLLSYFLEETEETVRRDRGFFDGRKEKFHRSVYRDLKKEE